MLRHTNRYIHDEDVTVPEGKEGGREGYRRVVGRKEEEEVGREGEMEGRRWR